MDPSRGAGTVVASDPDYSDFEKDGADTVLKNLAQDSYDPKRRKLAIAWLEQSEAKRAVVAGRVSSAAKIARRAVVVVLVLVIAAIILYQVFPYAK